MTEGERGRVDLDCNSAGAAGTCEDGVTGGGGQVHEEGGERTGTGRGIRNGRAAGIWEDHRGSREENGVWGRSMGSRGGAKS